MTKLFRNIRRSRFFLRQLSVSAILICLVFLIFFAGFEVGKRNLFPQTLLNKVEDKVGQVLRFTGLLEPKGHAPKLASRSFPSHLIQLVSDVGLVSTGRDPWRYPETKRRDILAALVSETGGGMTSFGSDVLLLPYSGQIYAASSSSDIRATKIVAPDNNRADYQAAADDPAFKDYDFHKGYLRYNDIIFVDGAYVRALIASYTEYHADRACYTNTLARLNIDSNIVSIDEVTATSDDWTVIYRTKPCLPLKTQYLALEGVMAGGRMAFQPPSTLLLTSGDFHLDGMRADGAAISQVPQSEYGKVIAVDLLTGAAQIMSTGHRNPQGITITPKGHLIVAEHGPRGGDELNLIRSGANFGWPLESYGITKNRTRIPGSLSYGRHETFEAPILAWVPSVAISSLTVIENFHPEWDGDLLVGTLKDMSLYRVRMAGDQAIYSERIPIGSRIRYVHQHSDGRLVLWTDNEELIFLGARDRSNLDQSFDGFIARSGLPDRPTKKLEIVVDRCAECHSFEVDDHQNTPSLARIFGNDIASTTFNGYSDALSDKGGQWTRESLTAYLRNPQDFSPGSSMPSTQIEDETVLNALVSYLVYLDQQY